MTTLSHQQIQDFRRRVCNARDESEWPDESEMHAAIQSLIIDRTLIQSGDETRSRKRKGEDSSKVDLTDLLAEGEGETKPGE
jgi:hypothetical protein